MKATEAASARAAAPATANDRSSNKCPAAAALPTAVVIVAMSAVSLPFYCLATRALHRCAAMAAEDEVLPGLLWGLSPLISAYLYCWSVALSPAPRAEVADGRVATRGTCLLLVAIAADKLMAAPVAGAAALVLSPLLSACACGRALAERLQRAAGGDEPWSAAAVAATPAYRSRGEELEERRRRESAVFAMGLTAVAFSVVTCLFPWIAPPETKWPEPPPTEVVFYLAGPLFVVTRLMMPFLAGSPVLAAVEDMVAFAAVIGFIGWLVVAVSANASFGTIAGAVVGWIGELAMVGILGYFLAVEAHYKELMIKKRKEPRRAKDASGLLDGRDSGDACSAHIDVAAAAAACPCLHCAVQ